MNKLEMIRGAVNFVVTLGVGNIVSDGLNKIQPAKAQGALRKFTTKIGGLAIGLYAADKIGDHVDKGFFGWMDKTSKSEIPEEITEEKIEDEA